MEVLKNVKLSLKEMIGTSESNKGTIVLNDEKGVSYKVKCDTHKKWTKYCDLLQGKTKFIGNFKTIDQLSEKMFSMGYLEVVKDLTNEKPTVIETKTTENKEVNKLLLLEKKSKACWDRYYSVEFQEKALRKENSDINNYRYQWEAQKELVEELTGKTITYTFEDVIA